MNGTTSWRSTPTAAPACSRPTSRDARRPRRVAGLLLAALAQACAPPSPLFRAASDPAPAELLRAEPLTRGTEPEPVPAADLLGVDADMDDFLAARVDPGAPAPVRLEQLLAGLMGRQGLAVAYDGATHTAAEAFHLRQANCLSYTSLFVALARRAGLQAGFEEVEIPPDWTRDGDSLVLNRHVNALVAGRTRSARVVDFDMADFRAAYPRRPISDARALAHYYNNLGAARLAAEPLAALAFLRAALAADPDFAPAWVNLGSLYQRAGERAWARAAWLQAAAVDPRETVALSNLERLYRQEGAVAAADALRVRIERHRMANPYYRYYLAQQAVQRRDYDEAIAQLQVATRQQPAEDRFFALLGLAYLRAGDAGAARRSLAQAAAAATDEAARRGYRGKLDRLRRAGAG